MSPNQRDISDPGAPAPDAITAGNAPATSDPSPVSAVAPHLSLSHVTFSYNGKTPVLQDIDLEVSPSSFTCLVGGNGSGKSTLAKLCCGLILPGEGTVTILGQDTSQLQNPAAFHREVGMVMQNPDDQLVCSIVEADVAFGPQNLALPPEEIRQRVTSALTAVGLQDLANAETAALSGGQKQRLAIAGALALHPKILILDEATAMLDPVGRAQVLSIARELNAQGVIIMLITHHMQECLSADTVVAMHEGRILRVGTPQQVLTDDQVLAACNLRPPLAVQASRKLQLRCPNFPLCLTAEDLEEAYGRLIGASGTTVGNTSESGVDATSAASGSGVDVTLNVASRSGASREAATDSAVESDIDATAGKDAEPAVSFQNVSFTFQPPAKKKSGVFRKKERKNAKIDVQCAPQDPSPASPRAQQDTSADIPYALRNVSLTIPKGSFFGVAGATGSGKSTLLMHVNGLLTPSAGCVSTWGFSTSEPAESANARRKCAYLFQYPERQLFAATVEEDIAFGPRNLGWDKERVGYAVANAIARVGLSPKVLTRNPHRLSGGQQRLVALAGVLACDPQILILDEPAAGLDPEGHDRIMTLLKELHQTGLTLLMASHDMNDLASLCTHVAVLNRGSLADCGTPQQIFGNERLLTEAGLQVPYAQELAYKLRNAGARLSQSLYTAESLVTAL
ncbi:MAG: energy-coupling factor transporter ATPase [Eggerthellales bacterium]|nr:energy-coupling factor transporter ATPase [Eggerthellales bacterium]